MKDFFKNIGIPASLAALVSAAVTISFFVFQVDSRYAKSDAVAAESKKLDDKIDAAVIQLSQLNGSVQVLLQISTRLNESHEQNRRDSERTAKADDEIKAVVEQAAQSNMAATLPPRPIAAEQSTIATAQAMPAPLLTDQLAEVHVPTVSDEAVKNANYTQISELLKATDEALDRSDQNLKTIRGF